MASTDPKRAAISFAANRLELFSFGMILNKGNLQTTCARPF